MARRRSPGTLPSTGYGPRQEHRMSFRISGLPLAPFAPLFGLSDEELASRSIQRHTADVSPGFPCRVSLQDAAPGETLLLLNYEHLSVASPYRSRYALYVREGVHVHNAKPGCYAARVDRA